MKLNDRCSLQPPEVISLDDSDSDEFDDKENVAVATRQVRRRVHCVLDVVELSDSESDSCS